MPVTSAPLTITTYQGAPPAADRLEPIRDTSRVKPSGGLWATPAGTPDWLDWQRAEDWEDDLTADAADRGEDPPCWHLDVVPRRGLVVINTLADLRYLRRTYPPAGGIPAYGTRDGYYAALSGPPVSFGAIAADYDGIRLTDNGQRETRLPDDYEPSLYGWDLESVLLFTFDVVSDVRAANAPAQLLLTPPTAATRNIADPRRQRPRPPSATIVR